MDDIDAFLDSIEDAPGVAHGTGGATLDEELEALFDDFNAMVNVKGNPAGKYSNIIPIWKDTFKPGKRELKG